MIIGDSQDIQNIVMRNYRMLLREWEGSDQNQLRHTRESFLFKSDGTEVLFALNVSSDI